MLKWDCDLHVKKNEMTSHLQDFSKIVFIIKQQAVLKSKWNYNHLQIVGMNN